MRTKEKEQELKELIAQYDGLIRKKAAECWDAGAKHIVALSFEDLYQAGRAGLVEAFDTFIPSKGVPFQAHVSLRVGYAVFNEYSRWSDISRMARTALTQLQKDREVAERLYDRPVTGEELADYLSLLPEELDTVIDDAYGSAPAVISLSGLQGTFGEEAEIACEVSNVEALAYRGELGCLADECLSVLHPKERRIIREIFYEDKLFEDVGLSFGISRQRVAVIKNQALDKIRRYLSAQKFSPPEDGI